LFGIVPAKGAEVSECGKKRAFHLGVYMRFLKSQLTALQPPCTVPKANNCSNSAKRAKKDVVLPAAPSPALKAVPAGALLLFVTNDLRAVPYISHGRHVGAIKNGCHYCSVEAISRKVLGTDSACYVDAVRHLGNQRDLLVKLRNGPGLASTVVKTTTDLKKHFATVFHKTEEIAELAKKTPLARNTHDGVVAQGRAFEGSYTAHIFFLIFNYFNSIF